MSATLSGRLNQILPRVTSEIFLSSEGIGNEIACYIFDYPAKDELAVREHIEVMMKRFASHHSERERTANGSYFSIESELATNHVFIEFDAVVGCGHFFFGCKHAQGKRLPRGRSTMPIARCLETTLSRT